MTPPGQRWFIAEIVQRIRVAGDPRVVVHVNFQLVRAKDAAAAYTSAIKLGKSEEASYANPQGQRVTIRFVGLRDLHRVHDELEHGGELLYEEYVQKGNARSSAMVRPRNQLAALRSDMPERKGPDYSAGDVVRAVERMVSHSVRSKKPRITL